MPKASSDQEAHCGTYHVSLECENAKSTHPGPLVFLGDRRKGQAGTVSPVYKRFNNLRHGDHQLAVFRARTMS